MQRKTVRSELPQLRLLQRTRQRREDAGYALPKSKPLLLTRRERIANRERQTALL